MVKESKGKGTTQRRPLGEGPMSEIPRLIGADLARRLFEEFGGMFVVFPKGPGNNPAGAKKFAMFSTVIGADAVVNLGQHYNGAEVYIPLEADRHRKERNAKIVGKFDAGSLVNDLAREFGLSCRAIEVIINNPK